MNWRLSLVVLSAAIAIAGAGLVAAGQAVPPSAQTAPPPSGLILGTVVDADSKHPLSNVVVTIAGAPVAIPYGPSTQPRSVLTDADGHFVFRQLAKGSYTLSATVGGNGFSPNGFIVSGSGFLIGAYLNGGFGQRRPNGPLQAIDLADGQRVGDAVIRLWKPGVITGTVVDEAGEPLVGQVVGAVQVSSDERLLTGPTTKTDDRGIYRFGSLVPGRYLVYVPQMQLLMPESSIDPLVNGPSDPVAMTRLSNAGAPTSPTSGVAVGASRLAIGVQGLVANSLTPRTQGATAFSYPTTFYPSATSAARAGQIFVEAGKEQSGATVMVRPVKSVRLSGTLIDAAGPVPQFGAHLMPADAGDGASVLEVARTSTDARGVFMFPLVPEGQYTLIAMRTAPVPSGDPNQPFVAPRTVSEQPGAWATQSVTVGAADVTGLTLTIRAGVQLTGHIAFEGQSGHPPPNRIKQAGLRLDQARPVFRSDGAPRLDGVIDDADQILVPGIPPGRYVVQIQNVPGWSLQSVTIGGRDVTDAAFAIDTSDVSALVITYTDRPAELGGSVQDDRAAGADAAVLVFPVDRARWADARVSYRTFRTVRVSSSGTFQVPGMVPGEYFVVAVTDAAASDWPDEVFLSKLASRAVAVRVAAGQKVTTALKVSDIR